MMRNDIANRSSPFRFCFRQSPGQERQCETNQIKSPSFRIETQRTFYAQRRVGTHEEVRGPVVVVPFGHKEADFVRQVTEIAFEMMHPIDDG